MKKFTPDYVRSVFEQEGYTLLSNYVDCKMKQSYICPKGHNGSSSFDNFKRGKRCHECRLEEASERYRHDYDEVFSTFEKAGCVLLTDKYVNGKTPLDYICSCGNTSTIRYSDFKRGERCNACAISRRQNAMQSNGQIPISKQQRQIHSLIGGQLNYRVNNLFLDIAFPDEKIYFEFDGSGHDLSVKKKDLTQKEFDEKQRKRTYALYRAGWKEIRFISRRDRLPSDERIVELFETGKQILKEGHSYCIFDFDNHTIEYGRKVFDVNFGEQHRIRV